MILVVDDDPRIVETFRLWLEEVGLTVETASDGIEAYDKAVSPACECIILDVNMPNFNGPSLLLILQSEGTHVPVIVVTGERGFTADEMQQFANVVALFDKPVERDVLLAAVAEQVGNVGR